MSLYFNVFIYIFVKAKTNHNYFEIIEIFNIMCPCRYNICILKLLNIFLFFTFFSLLSLSAVGFSPEAMRSEAIRQDPTRKGSVVNVNPTNTRPQSDTPEIRKYKKRFNSEILCAALWGIVSIVDCYFIPIFESCKLIHKIKNQLRI